MRRPLRRSGRHPSGLRPRLPRRTAVRSPTAPAQDRQRHAARSAARHLRSSPPRPARHAPRSRPDAPADRWTDHAVADQQNASNSDEKSCPATWFCLHFRRTGQRLRDGKRAETPSDCPHRRCQRVCSCTGQTLRSAVSTERSEDIACSAPSRPVSRHTDPSATARRCRSSFAHDPSPHIARTGGCGCCRHALEDPSASFRPVLSNTVSRMRRRLPACNRKPKPKPDRRETSCIRISGNTEHVHPGRVQWSRVRPTRTRSRRINHLRD